MKIRKIRSSLFPKIFPAIILAFMTLSPLAAIVHGMLPSGELIYPGVGIDTVKIGELRPAKLPQNLEKNIREKKVVIEAQGNQKLVSKITIYSSEFILSSSRLRVQSSTLDDVLRYYGKGRVVERGSKQTVQFSSEGLEFVINKQNGKIESISVFPPARPKIPIQQYKQYKEQFKQSR